MKPRPISDKLLLPNIDGTCEIIAAGEAEFPNLVPDQWTAFARVRFAKSLPMVVGPESINGAVFGIHPAVVARSFPGIQYKQMNMGHTLRSLNKKEDRICGCVLHATFPEEPASGWVIGENVEEAPHITAVAALFKQAFGVPKMLGEHLGGVKKMSVSMEFTYYYAEMGIYDPLTRMTYDRADIPANLKGFTYEDENGRLGIRQSARKPPLAIALGGLSGRIWFSGIGYTDRPAEETAGIESIAAARHEQGLIACGSLTELPLFAPGMEVKWPGGEYGRGRVAAMHMGGRHTRFGKTLCATPQEPVLEIDLPNGARIIRRASSVTKKI